MPTNEESNAFLASYLAANPGIKQKTIEQQNKVLANNPDTSTWQPRKYEQKLGLDYVLAQASTPLNQSDLSRIAGSPNRVTIADQLRLGVMTAPEATYLARDIQAGKKPFTQYSYNYQQPAYNQYIATANRYYDTEHTQIPAGPRPYETTTTTIPRTSADLALEKEGKLINGKPSAEFLMNYYGVKATPSGENTPSYYYPDLLERYAKETNTPYWMKQHSYSTSKTAPTTVPAQHSGANPTSPAGPGHIPH